MSRMVEAWEQVLREAISKDYDVQQFALFQIGLVLQRHNPYVKPDSDVFEQTLSRDLLRLALDVQRQRDAVLYLVTLIRQYPKDADSIFYALGNAQPAVLAEPLVALLIEKGASFKQDVLYQGLIALEGAARYSRPEQHAAFKQAALLPLLDLWSESHDQLIADRAARVLRLIQGMDDKA